MLNETLGYSSADITLSVNEFLLVIELRYCLIKSPKENIVKDWMFLV